MYRFFIKPLLDFILALIGFLLLSPVFIIVTIGLFFANQGKPFFFQLRPGKDGEIFKIIKFKTMNDKKDEHGNLLPDACRLTKIGNFVRETSLDEIPQLLNVIKGDMSLIGPRPLLPSYLALYNDFQRRRNEVKPGITGWAQVNGRNSISWEKKFEYDVWYVDHISFILDFKILFLTIKKVFVREGISQDGQTTMEGFKGNN
ncbi:sugar transferase [Capnocytophaga canimorsus]|uniref:sugar transferase n=1 Tax=Capnocytophaga canimorsus TaxID=28188 RepID=UPI000BB16D31|nr:sugar transferase [Capnocytophaga canimorsus]ATA77279.1 lipid carrier--UDP-N-acetylgalactosaminyltransferase [Capnocytophaga canimorsus]AWL78743.1 sugar transferase [Capnocytophaga canimorsus]AYW37353.1 sugar transferase [Capnocytophaga canimorsus]MDT9500126.1 sugar transferase [Capnocytophaga canimorsus]PJI83560.1 lipopolysaccharide/colanic/teichoic acid biosynthesis glycosyltransferase [Capnocytophaga canimorsus]